MKLLIALSIFLALAISSVHAQTKGPATVTLSGSTVQSVVLTWVAPAPVTGGWAGCTTAAPCTYIIDVIAGSCPTPTIGSANWSSFPAQSATTLTDSTEVAGSTNSYVAYTMQGGSQSNPSNCITLTLPFDPPPPVISGSGL